MPWVAYDDPTAVQDAVEPGLVDALVQDDALRVLLVGQDQLAVDRGVVLAVR